VAAVEGEAGSAGAGVGGRVTSEVSATGQVYVFRLGEFHKIGRSKDTAKRLQAFATLPYEMALVHTIHTDDPKGLEKLLHRRFAHCRVRGEWFRLSDEELDLLCCLHRADAIVHLQSAYIPKPEPDEDARSRFRSIRISPRARRALCWLADTACRSPGRQAEVIILAAALAVGWDEKAR
jgi:hypothetical protein